MEIKKNEGSQNEVIFGVSVCPNSGGLKKKGGCKNHQTCMYTWFHSIAKKIVRKRMIKKLYENCILFIARFGLKNLPFNDHHFSYIKQIH